MIRVIKLEASNNPYESVQCYNCRKVGWTFNYYIIAYGKTRHGVCENCMREL